VQDTHHPYRSFLDGIRGSNPVETPIPISSFNNLKLRHVYKSETVNNKPKVILRHCETYDPERIAEIIGEGMDELGVKPRGRTMVKPNVVIAHPEIFPNAFTRSEFLDGLLTAVKLRNDEVSELYIGERCGITIPTRAVFATAGYLKVLRKHGIRAEYFDEGAQIRFDLKHPDAMRDFILIPEGVMRCEFLINAPKFKAHPWTKVTFALKNYIGIQDDPQRLIDHDHMLHTKIADLQEVISPGFIAPCSHPLLTLCT
jgi:uncharacterized protein (DUF362 family)